MTVTAEQFLRHVLPDDGYKCATIISGKTRYNKFFADFHDLAQFILFQDALGNTVYHACASFKIPQNDPRETPRNQRTMGRTSRNVMVAQSFWFDIDAAKNKPYQTAQDAYLALISFCARVGLPSPTVVGSGAGLHAYFTLVEPCVPELWLAYATGLKQLATREGFHAGPERTADISSILRTPGTHHRKDGEKEVWCDGLEGPYELEDLGELHALALSSLQASLPKRGKAAAPHDISARSVSDAATNIYVDIPSDPQLVAIQCRQVGSALSAPGQSSEPHWYAAIGALAHCQGGEELALERADVAWHAAVRTKFEQQRSFGPTTCQHFEKINPQGCEECPHFGKITSPIQLGRLVSISDVARPAAAMDGQREQPESIQLLFPVRSSNPPLGFAINGHGLLFQTEVQGKATWEVVSRNPIYLDKIQTGEILGDSFSLCFKLHLPQEGVKSIVIPAKTFFSTQGMSEMAGRGAVIHDSDLFKKYTREAMDLWHMSNKLETRYDQFGWKNDNTGFLFGERLYGAGGVAEVAGSDEIRTRSQYLGPARNGSLDKWSAAANTLFAQGCEPQSFALLCAFAAPLMRFHSSGEGGAIISLVSDQSGSGKTTALEAAASVWGRLKGTQLTDDDTRVSKGLTLGALGNLPCIYDELYNRDPEMIRQFVMMFTNGRDKMRGTSDGKLQHSKAEWQTLLITASNTSLVDTLNSIEGTDAPAFRVLEFISSLPPGVVSRGDELKRVLFANSGFAGEAYLRVLLQPQTLAYVQSALPQWTENIWKRTGLETQHRFWVRTLASVVAAGVLVRHAGILDFSVQRITDWAIAMMRDRQGQATVTGVRTPTSVLAEYFHANINSMLVMPIAWRPKTSIRPLLEPKKELMIRYEMSEGRAFILDSDLRKWLVKKGVNRAGFMAELKARNVIISDYRRVTLGAGTDFASGQVTTVEVNMKHPALSGIAVDVEQVIPEVPLGMRNVVDDIRSRR